MNIYIVDIYHTFIFQEEETFMKKNRIYLTIQIIMSIIISAAVVFSHGRSGMPYDRINRCTEYILLHNTDIRGRVDYIRSMAEQVENSIKESISKYSKRGSENNN